MHSQVPRMNIPVEVNISDDGASETYLIRLVSEKGQEIAQIKANRLEVLKRIVEDIKDQRQQLENIGLPLTIEPHDKAASSLLSENRSIGNIIEKTFTDILPAANLRWTINAKTSFKINYITNTQMPSATQLQPVADVSDPMNIFKGNPDLKRSYVHSLTANLININIPRGRIIFMMAAITKTNNAKFSI